MPDIRTHKAEKMIDQLTCEETFRRLDDFLDRELSENECRLVREHLEICAVCAKEFEFEASLWNEVRAKLQHTVVPPNLREKVSLLLKETECFKAEKE